MHGCLVEIDEEVGRLRTLIEGIEIDEEVGRLQTLIKGVDKKLEDADAPSLKALLQSLSAKLSGLKKLLDDEAKKDDELRQRERRTLDAIDAYLRKYP